MEISFYTYILKSAFCLSIFYLCYRLWLSKETFYKFNRFLLLGLLLTAFIIPTLKVSHSISIYQIEQTFQQLEAPVVEVEKTLTISEEDPTAETILPVELENRDLIARILTINNLWILYCLGIVFGISRYIGSMACIYRLIRRSEKRQWKDDINLVIHQQNIAPFSWRRYIVLSQQDLDEYGVEILAHEQAHIDHKHYGDLLLVDICCLLQWFNPAVWLFKSELKAIHEFEADESVLKEGINITQYQLLLIKKAVGTRLYSMANNFSHNSLKKRITMMLKERSNPRKLLKYFVVLPLVATTVALFARPNLLEGSMDVNKMYKDTLNPQEISVLESYAEADTVQILKLDMQNLRILENRINWAMTISSNGSIIKEVAAFNGVKRELRLSSTIPWTPETLRNFTEVVKVDLLKSLNKSGENVEKSETALQSSKNTSTTATSVISSAFYEVNDFFEVYRENWNYKEQLILLDGKKITYEKLQKLHEGDILGTYQVLPTTTNLEKRFGEDAKNGILVLVSKKDPTYWDKFIQQLK